MKKVFFNATALLFMRIATLIVITSLSTSILISGCSDSSANLEQSKPTPISGATIKNSPIDGAWELVWGKYNGVVENLKKPSQFKMFHDGFFSLIAWDSTGKFSFGGYGKFELDGSIYKETFTYHDNPEYVGGSGWQEYELKGDTLYFKGFNKLIVQGKERTDFPKIEEKRVRAK